MLHINEQDTKTAEYLKSIGVSYDVNHTAEMLHDKEWQHDLFYIVFTAKNHKVEGFEYKTGIGHRITPPTYKNGRQAFGYSTEQQRELKKLRELIGKSGLIEAKKAVTKCVTNKEAITMPTQASVLYGLVLDSSAGDESLPDWCDNYGYDSDSMKALSIYNACIENAKKLNNIFTREQLEAISELLEGY